MFINNHFRIKNLMSTIFSDIRNYTLFVTAYPSLIIKILEYIFIVLYIIKLGTSQ